MDNYYIILDLDPQVSDWAVIEQKIIDKQRVWSKDLNQGNPVARMNASRYMKLVNNIKETLQDPQRRAEMAQQAREELERKRQAAFKDLTPFMEMIKFGGVKCPRSTITQIFNDLGHRLSEKEIEDYLRSAGIIIDDGKKEAPEKPVKPKLEKANMSDIRKDLDLLRLENLYGFLGLKKNTASDQLKKQADEIYREYQPKPINPERDARLRLCGYCKDIFASDKKKEKYDNSMDEEAMLSLERLINVAGEDKIIVKEELEHLLKLALEKNVKTEVALAYIEEYAGKKNWVVQKVERRQIDDFKQCGFCYTVNAPLSVHCTRCGEPLVMECPQCRQKVPTQDSACSKCGTPMGNALEAQKRIEEGRQYLLVGDLKKALELFDHALVFCPSFREALEGKKEAEEKRAALERAIGDIEEMVKGKKLISAEHALEKLSRTYAGADTEKLRAKVKEGTAKARQLFSEAESLFHQGRGEAAFLKYEECLSFCADHSDAVEKASRCSPEPPSHLVASPNQEHNTVRLTWKRSPSPLVLSLIVRKRGTPPTGPEDSRIDMREVIKEEQWEDHNPPSGEPFYYAVYAQRRKGYSLQGSVSTRIFMASGVSGLILSPADSSVNAAWKAPEHAAVYAVRKCGSPPLSLSDGEKVTVLGNNSFSDKGLRNDETYHYLLVCEYKDGEKSVYSNGVRQSATPLVPPQPIAHLLFERDEKGLRIIWNSPPRGSVSLYRSETSHSISMGESLSISDLMRLGNSVQGESLDSLGIVDRSVPGGVCYYTPVTIIGEIAVVGKSHIYVALPEVSQVEAKAEGKGIHLLWEWPPHIGYTKVLWTYGSFDDPSSVHTESINIATYKSRGCHISLDPSNTVHFLIQAASNVEGKEIYSPGVTKIYVPTSHPKVSSKLTYSIKRQFLGAGLTLTLKCMEGALVGCSFALVGRQGARPSNVSDGEMIGSFENISLAPGAEQAFQCKVPRNSKGLVMGLLSISDAAASPRIIDPPPRERTL